MANSPGPHRAEFDAFAADYKRVHAQNIAASGEEPAYFAQYKMADFKRIVQRYGCAENGRYVDFGSGVGTSIEPFKQVLPGATLVCADVSAASLAQSQAEHGSRAVYSLISDGRLDLPDASVDGAFACCVFHHIPADQQPLALAELRRVLKPGAPLMVYEHNPLNPLTVRAVNTCPLDVNAVLIRAPLMAWRLRQAGFASVDTEYRVFFPALLKRLRFLERGLRWLPLGAQYFACARR